MSFLKLMDAELVNTESEKTIEFMYRLILNIFLNMQCIEIYINNMLKKPINSKIEIFKKVLIYSRTFILQDDRHV
jgi:hypothetical protein